MITKAHHVALAVWIEEGWTEAAGREWLAAWFAAGDPEDLDDARWQAGAARAWHAAGVPATLATRWAPTVDDPAEASLWALAGYAPDDVALLYAAVDWEQVHRATTEEPPIPYAPLDWITTDQPLLVIRAAILAGYTPLALEDLAAETGKIDMEGLRALARYRHTQ